VFHSYTLVVFFSKAVYMQMITAVVATATLLAVAHGASFCDEAGWAVAWRDEFDGAALDNATWSRDVGHHASTTRESVGTVDNAYVENGSLVLRSQRQAKGRYNFTTGAVRSRGKKFWRGPRRVCVRAQLPGSGPGNRSGLGIWPAHWMMPEGGPCWPSGGEIDIMEMTNGDGTLKGTYHWAANCSKAARRAQQGRIQMPADWGTGWHELGVEYSLTGMKWALDGAVYQAIPNAAQKPLERPAFYALPYYMILNTAVGLWLPGGQQPTADTVFPTYHRIDYVRVATPKRNV
jgi:beta-glucanase (GH16 family)